MKFIFAMVALAGLVAGQDEAIVLPDEAPVVAPVVAEVAPEIVVQARNAPGNAAVVAADSIFNGYVFSDGYLEVLGGEPDRSFDCDGRQYGYYADVANDCRIFHVCVPLQDDAGAVIETQQFSFFCGNTTVFSQDSLTCNHAGDAYPCAESEQLYDSVNSLFGQIDKQLNE